MFPVYIIITPKLSSLEVKNTLAPFNISNNLCWIYKFIIHFTIKKDIFIVIKVWVCLLIMVLINKYDSCDPYSMYQLYTNILRKKSHFPGPRLTINTPKPLNLIQEKFSASLYRLWKYFRLTWRTYASKVQQVCKYNSSRLM